ncbi:MAG: UDP-N-acetylmuramoyl-L-alanyl-D-glutamate--2,6-diaminopimelate ligase [Clostridia bacterium]|nr:UDP-N-acetylmuramoyl-L-alanyl-D-glutamate--2,6-diaminopimelate ligase [Clostridia bacterium]
MKRLSIDELLSGTDISIPKDMYGASFGICTDSEECSGSDILFITKTSRGESRHLSLAGCPAAAIVCEDDDRPDTSSAPILVTDDARRSLAVAASNLYQIDYEKTKFVGVTGTNGKTTTATMIRNILTYAGHLCGFIGTGKIKIGELEIQPQGYTMTTPDPMLLYRSIGAMQEAGCEYIVMEVSSHALMLQKVAPIRFKIGLFTNLSGEHMDFHADMEDYYAAKIRLFDQSECGIFCLDDPYSKRAYEEAKCEKISVGVINSADVYATDVQLMGLDGSHLFYRERDKIFGLKLPYVGAFNVYNALMAIKCAIRLGVRPCIAKEAISKGTDIDGRMEMIHGDVNVIIDYAHTPAALENALKVLFSGKITRQKLHVVFGCGGNRDAVKRPLMGIAASRYADDIILTEDNSRDEDTSEIIRDIASGIANGTPYKIIPKRRDAITEAILSASKGDIVAIFGKGHERYIIDKAGMHDFDERAIISEALELWKLKNEN